MHLRDALITQAPSLALQRAAASEVARLDDLIHTLLRASLAAAAALDGPAALAQDDGHALRLLRIAILKVSL